MAKRKKKSMLGIHIVDGLKEFLANPETANRQTYVRVAADDPRTDADIRSVMLRATARGEMKGLTPDDVIDVKVIRGDGKKP